MTDLPWWEAKSLHEMSREEWEQLCDHCGKCCLHKLEDEEDGTVYYTDVACHLMDQESCHCTDYANRRVLVPSCVRLDIGNLDQINWMPPSCSYRLLKEGQTLPDWHHLVSGSKQTIHQVGASVHGRSVNEKDVDEDEFEEHIVEWPLDINK